jgi:hypothetical protein
MTARCAEWTRLEPLIARRMAGDDAAEALLSAASFAHFEDCPGCRRAALALDPTLVLRPLAEPMRQEAERDEVEAMRVAVATLRRSRSTAPVSAGAGRWWKVAAAAALVAGALYQLPLPSAAPQGTTVAAAVAAAPGVLPAEFSNQPVVEDLDRPDARVYQLGGGDVSVVMIVDESLDV